MCGIMAAFGPLNASMKDKLAKASRSMHHRGPDSSDHWFDEKQGVYLAHNRLSIIDLNTGSQPLYSKKRDIVAIVNGEFYDYKRIREDLKKKSYEFRTKSDSEILIPLYQEYGIQCLEWLRGEFSFILWDNRKKMLFAARDRFGIKPLNYTISDGRLYLASEAKAFKELGLELSWNSSEFVRQMSRLHSCRESLFKGVHEIPPGHYLVQKDFTSTPRIQKYWDFNYPKEQDLNRDISVQEATERFTELFTESIKLRLEADLPIASSLSGGIDSCFILGVASKYSSTPIPSFTLSFTNQEYDELHYAKKMASYVNSDIHITDVDINKLADVFEQTVYHAESLFFNCNGAAKLLLNRAVHEAGYKVILSGQGADEILAGYAPFREDINPSVEFKKQLLEQNQTSQGLLSSSKNISDIQFVNEALGFTPQWLKYHKLGFDLVLSFINEQHHQQLQTNSPLHMLLGAEDIKGQLDGREKLSKSLYLWSKSFLPGLLLSAHGDKMEMAHSLEARIPFLDHKVVEYVRSLPSNLKIRDNIEKYILKQAARAFVPEEIYKRQKQPFLTPPILKDKESRFYHLVNDLLRGQAMENLPFISKEKVIKVLDQYQTYSTEDQKVYDNLFTALTCACIIQKSYNVSSFS